MSERAVEVDTGYYPQPKQILMHESDANEILFGGAAGGGKSASLRAEALDWSQRIKGLQIYLFRRTFPEIEKNHILPSLHEFPRALGTYIKQYKRWEFFNGSMLHFCHCQYEGDVFNYQGAEIHLLIMDELTTFTEFQYDYLRGRVRCTLDIPDKMRHKVPGIVCASNPGGIGHEFAKRRWVDPAEPMQLWRAPEKEGGMLRCYIPSRLEDNFVLMRTDPGYVHRLDALPEPYRTAYKDGNWDIFIGQAFNFNRQDHVIDPVPIPAHAPVYMTFDWGFGAPFSVGWWWVDADGRLYRFSEWYGWNGTVNQGLRLEDSEVAKGIKAREETLGITGRVQTRLAGPDCFNKKPDYKGGGQGPSTAEVFASEGIYLSPGDADRSLKIRQFRERLRVPGDGAMPMLVAYRTCEQFIRTIPLIQTDPKNVEYIIDDGEAHCFDDACLICMARPMALEVPSPLIMPNMAEIYVDRIESEDEMDPLLELYGLDQEGEEALYASDFGY